MANPPHIDNGLGKGYVTLKDMGLLFGFWVLLITVPLLLFGTATKKNTYALPTVAVLSAVAWGFQSETFDKVAKRLKK